MATQPEVVRQSDLLNQLVLDRSSMAELGHIDVLWMHPPVHRVLGFICKSGFLGTKKTAFNLSQIKTLGANSILVNAKPVETDAEKVRQLESLINCEVWSDAGNKTGRIVDYLFNFKTGEIIHYLFVSNGWGGIAGSVYLLPPSKILSFGNKRVLVSEAATQNLAVYSEGIKRKLSKARNIFKEDYILATQELRSLAEQAKDGVQSLNEQLKEGTQNLAKQVRERTQIISEQVKENTQTLTEQVKENLEPAINKSSVPPEPISAPTSNPTQTTPTILEDEDDDEPWI